MFHVYVFQSEATGHHYVGDTSDPTQRLGQHNTGITKSAKYRGPWTLIYQESLPTKVDAMQGERFWKTGQGREELKQLLSVARSAG
jgi:putative endonuclease